MVKGRQVKERIDSIEETQKISRVMKMIASSRIKKAQQRIEEARPFIRKVEDFIYNLGFCKEILSDRLIDEGEVKNTVLIVGITADRGLCGGYNSNIINLVKQQIKKYESQGKKVMLDIIGTKGKNHFQYAGYKLNKVYEHLSEWPKFMDAREISRDLISRYVVGDVDLVIFCYTKFINTAIHNAKAAQMLPIPIMERMEERLKEDGIETEDGLVCRYLPDFYYEPSLKEIVRSIIPEYIFTKVYGILLTSTASEIGARMTAMQKASDNSDELIKELTKKYHKLRQEEITTEIVEVVSGSENYDR